MTVAVRQREDDCDYIKEEKYSDDDEAEKKKLMMMMMMEERKKLREKDNHAFWCLPTLCNSVKMSSRT